MPPLFAPYVQEQEPPLLLLKLPRNIERRRASPGMDLYDFVVGTYEDHLSIYHRVENTVEKAILDYQEMQGIQVYRKFLKGVLTFFTKRGRIELPFNSVSLDIIMELAALVRPRITSLSTAQTEGLAAIEPQNLEVMFVNLLRDLRESGEDGRVIAYQPTRELSKPRRFPPRRGKETPGTLHLLSGQELIVLQRGESDRDDQDLWYCYAFLYIPLSSIRDIRFHERTTCADMEAVEVCLDGDSLSFLFEQGNGGLEVYRVMKISVMTEKYFEPLVRRNSGAYAEAYSYFYADIRWNFYGSWNRKSRLAPAYRSCCSHSTAFHHSRHSREARRTY